ncbi:ATP-dependent exoDNAse beta subunit [Grosmannia clavigera kw1407]|uniref:ATP-dependent exoDNAse beta subunit n=1 Tax=Grosmannia clavigera (strain kw1407 / UAMH 11150) TaxID=655863 RepID=F0XNS1_GROCL|nr:ATP-dependent exoDNAse beta subunit [Grosmannia clavigera kw1407]EFX00036.1 ATP-dependent exoDNAse beta subunit [Grosmannia clavigera kw1407]
MPPKGGRVMKQVQAATRRSNRNKSLAVRLQKQQGDDVEGQQRQKEEGELVDEGEEPQDTIRDEKNRDAIAKLSNVPLSEEQQKLRDHVLQFCRDSLRSYTKTQRPSVFVIQGDAGTGKSVVLNALFNELQRQARETGEGEKEKEEKTTTTKATKAKDGSTLVGTENYLVVNHPEMLKLYHRISAQFPFIRKTDLERPTSLINRLQKERPRGRSAADAAADVILVDEAHLLLSKKNAYKRFFGDNQLEELLKLGKVLVIVFDGKQSLRFDAFWDDAKLEDFLGGLAGGTALTVERHQLGEQFRVAAAPDMQRWIQALSVERTVLPRPRIDADRRAAGDLDAFDFRIYDDAGELYRALMQRNEEQGGGCRLLSTYDWPYRLPKPGQGGAAQKVWHVDCGSFRIPWDKYLPQIREPWSEQPDSYRYCGSVYTIQGFDLTYAGVILGPSVGYDVQTDRIVIHTDRYEDHAAFMGRKNDESALADKERIVLNSVNVLLTRGVRGLYVYAFDPALRKRLLAC